MIDKSQIKSLSGPMICNLRRIFNDRWKSIIFKLLFLLPIYKNEWKYDYDFQIIKIQICKWHLIQIKSLFLIFDFLRSSPVIMICDLSKFIRFCPLSKNIFIGCRDYISCYLRICQKSWFLLYRQRRVGPERQSIKSVFIGHIRNNHRPTTSLAERSWKDDILHHGYHYFPSPFLST